MSKTESNSTVAGFGCIVFIVLFGLFFFIPALFNHYEEERERERKIESYDRQNAEIRRETRRFYENEAWKRSWERLKYEESKANN